MDHLRDRFNELEDKLRKILSELNSLREENSKLKAENSHLQTVIAEQKKDFKDLEESDNLVKIAEKVSNNGDLDPEIKKQIDRYILEIDKCIALLRE